MAEFYVPEFNEAMRRLNESIDDFIGSMQSFKTALDSSGLPETILDTYEELELLRQAGTTER